MKFSHSLLISLLLVIGCSGGGSAESTAELTPAITPVTPSTPSSNALNITNQVFTNRSADCADYDATYLAAVRDLSRVLDFEANVVISASDGACSISADNIPNHDFNDATANFRTNAIEKNNNFNVSRSPKIATQVSPTIGQYWDAVMLNGVVADLKSGGCYSPSESRADADGNTLAGCTIEAEWNLVPLEYSTKFGADIHNAHVQPDGSYHYHGNPNAMFDNTPSGDGSPVIGFAADGFPIYGSYILDIASGQYRKVLSGYTIKLGSRGLKTSTNPGGDFDGVYEQDWEWTNSGDLDECNGMTYKNQYGYYVTDRYPFIIGCFRGTIDESFGK